MPKVINPIIRYIHSDQNNSNFEMSKSKYSIIVIVTKIMSKFYELACKYYNFKQQFDFCSYAFDLMWTIIIISVIHHLQ